jgi:hypothetical protein
MRKRYTLFKIADLQAVLDNAGVHGGLTLWLCWKNIIAACIFFVNQLCFLVPCSILFGDVAQLVERRVRNAKARGSIPLISTIVAHHSRVYTHRSWVFGF